MAVKYFCFGGILLMYKQDSLWQCKERCHETKAHGCSLAGWQSEGAWVSKSTELRIHKASLLPSHPGQRGACVRPAVGQRALPLVRYGWHPGRSSILFVCQSTPGALPYVSVMKGPRRDFKHTRWPITCLPVSTLTFILHAPSTEGKDAAFFFFLPPNTL